MNDELPSIVVHHHDDPDTCPEYSEVVPDVACPAYGDVVTEYPGIRPNVVGPDVVETAKPGIQTDQLNGHFVQVQMQPVEEYS